MDNKLIAIAIFFITVNLIAFLMMLIDKAKSEGENRRRISEGMLFFMATFFGSVGVYLGMFAFRHKTRKWYFILGIPMLIAENLAFLFLVYKLLFQS